MSPDMVPAVRAHPTAIEFADAWTRVRQDMEETGPLSFVEGLLSGRIARSGGNCLGAAMALLQAETQEMPLGLWLLAEAFAQLGHLDFVADWVREIFGRWCMDAYEHDRRRATFCERLAQCGTPADLHRFDVLLEGSTADKIFVIGLNKTGTTAIQAALQRAGVLCAPQSRHERLFGDWAARKFGRIIAFCRHFEAFQDVPFSLPYTYQALDQAFPGARFVLSLRDSAAQWYDSLVRFHRKVLFGGAPASWDRIDSHTYGYPGYVADVSRRFFRWHEFGLYDRDRAISLYDRHNDEVRGYFRDRGDALLVLNVAAEDAQARFADFLGLRLAQPDFERINSS